MTALRAALERAGFNRAELILYAQLQQFIRNGGTREGCVRVFDEAAAKMRGGGQPPCAGDGLVRSASAPRPTPDGGHSVLAATSGPGTRAAVGQPIASGKGQATSVTSTTLTVPPAREPSAGQRAAKDNVKLLAARTILDRKRTSDGRAWGSVHYYELAGMKRDGKLAREIENFLGAVNQKQQKSEIRKLLTPEQFELILTRAERANDY